MGEEQRGADADTFRGAVGVMGEKKRGTLWKCFEEDLKGSKYAVGRRVQEKRSLPEQSTKKAKRASG